MSFQIHDMGQHVLVTMEGFATLAEARSHFPQLATVLHRQRARSGRARVVVDTTRSQAQSAEVAQLLSESTADLYADGDRVALLVRSPLLRLQIRRVLMERAFPIFTDLADAEAYVGS